MVRPTHSPGYTLLELLVVLAVAGFILAGVANYSTQSMPGTKLKSAVQQLENTLRIAQAAAITDGAPVTVAFPSGADIYVVEPGGGSTPLPAGTQVSFKPFAFLPSPLPGIRFYPDGSAAGGEITVAGGGRTYHVMVDWLTSRVSLGD